jgi:hypothetical protein
MEMGEMNLSDVGTIGNGIMRPEGVMVLKDGALLTADVRGQCARIERTGETSFFGEVRGVPNGICVESNRVTYWIFYIRYPAVRLPISWRVVKRY